MRYEKRKNKENRTYARWRKKIAHIIAKQSRVLCSLLNSTGWRSLDTITDNALRHYKELDYIERLFWSNNKWDSPEKVATFLKLLIDSRVVESEFPQKYLNSISNHYNLSKLYKNKKILYSEDKKGYFGGVYGIYIKIY